MRVEKTGFFFTILTMEIVYGSSLKIVWKSNFLLRSKKICGFPVSRSYLAFGRRNPDPKLFYWIMRVSVST
jgi:hypothetical protein